MGWCATQHRGKLVWWRGLHCHASCACRSRSFYIRSFYSSAHGGVVVAFCQLHCWAQGVCGQWGGWRDGGADTARLRAQGAGALSYDCLYGCPTRLRRVPSHTLSPPLVHCLQSAVVPARHPRPMQCTRRFHHRPPCSTAPSRLLIGRLATCARPRSARTR